MIDFTRVPKDGGEEDQLFTIPKSDVLNGFSDFASALHIPAVQWDLMSQGQRDAAAYANFEPTRQVWANPLPPGPQEIEEVLGTGDGSATTFSKTLGTFPIQPGTFAIDYSMNGFIYTAADKDGDGVLSGFNVVSGAVNYETGEITMTFVDDPLVDAGQDINVYYYRAG